MGDTTVQTGQPTPAPQGDPAGTTPPNTQTSNGTPEGKNPSSKDGDEPLGPAGKKALQAEREARQELEKRLAPLERLAKALAGDNSDGKSEVEQLNERFARHEQELAEERQGRLREQVARRFELPDDLAELLKGATADELKAHAEVLKKYVPAKQETKSRPKPDRSQGGGAGNDGSSAKDQALAQARKRFGDTKKTT